MITTGNLISFYVLKKSTGAKFPYLIVIEEVHNVLPKWRLLNITIRRGTEVSVSTTASLGGYGHFYHNHKRSIGD